MGGFLFNYLESFDELRERVGVTRTRNECVGKLWNMTKELNILYERNWTAMADEILRDFQNSLYFAVKEKGWDGRDESNEEMQWSFSGSLLYSVTVITTIGYGHIAPKTEMGRLVTMLYALIGIPLTLLCISNIGSFFANCFRFLYKNICVCLERLCCSTRQRKARYSGSTSTMTTTASLKSVASRKSKSIKDINAEYEESRQALRKDNQDISVVEKGLQTAPRSGRESGKGCKHTGDDGEVNLLVVDDNSGRKSSNKEKVRVPMSVSLLIIFLYIFGGAVLFSCWEQDWSYLIGSYFCFITLSTIGFGDYVFGVGNDLDNSQKMITCALYLVLGLSIIAMCFELMQEEVRAKCRWLGAKLGIIESSKKTRKKKPVQPPTDTKGDEALKRVPSRGPKAISFCKVLIYVLLLVFLAGYATIGAYLFRYLEQEVVVLVDKNATYEQYKEELVLKVGLRYEQYKEELVLKILTEIDENFTLLVDNEVAQRKIRAVVRRMSVDVITVAEFKDDVFEWTFPSACLYSVTLITTIGYGNITPKTAEGRVISIIFAIVGIPLTLLYLTNMGSLLAIYFKYVYRRWISLLVWCKIMKRKRDTDIVPSSISFMVIVSYLLLGALLFSTSGSGWTFMEAMYFCFITLSTIGLGDYVFGADIDDLASIKPLVSVMYLILGLSMLSMTFNLMQADISYKVNALMVRFGFVASMKRAQMLIAD
ncbi:uncharacterized protein LOC131940243 [Physella acuta]|uniref:uncharacterized protein LOC131940243 n=1 Tax=Physella acuta TaxID=109671 RepID=UPI0027DDD75B|nr:uncharacterized protein LOC131940243 [Physella acuta]